MLLVPPFEKAERDSRRLARGFSRARRGHCISLRLRELQVLWIRLVGSRAHSDQGQP